MHVLQANVLGDFNPPLTLTLVSVAGWLREAL